jgi:mannosyltransferase
MGTVDEPNIAHTAATGETLRPRTAALTAQARHPTTAIVMGLTLLAAILRFATLNVQSIWLDESATIILVHRGFWGMLSHLSSSESAPPLYYMLVWAWTKAFGAGPLGFRSLSALIGTLTIPVMYLAGRRISPRVGLWAAALAVVNPAMYYYSQEARVYALLILFCGAAFVLWLRALETPDRRSLALWAGVSSLAVLTHYFAAFLFLPEAFILVRRLGWRRAGPPIGVVALVGLALAPLALAERADGKASWIEAESLTSRLAEAIKQFTVGLYAPLEIPAGVIVAALAAGTVVLLWRRGQPRELRVARDVAIVAVAALALPLLLAVTHLVDVFDGRNVIATWVPLAVLVAGGVGMARAGRIGPLLGGALCAVSLAVIVATNLTPAYQRDNWRGIAKTLSTPTTSRVVIGEEFASLPLSVYLGSFQGTSGTSVTTRELDFVALRMKRSARSPLPPVVPTSPPSGFQLAGVHRTESYAVSRFIAARPTAVPLRVLRRTFGDPKAEVVIQR